VDFDQQMIAGSFEHALCHMVDHELDLTAFHTRYNNDHEGVLRPSTLRLSSKSSC
jgi:hypothetical protein